MVNKMIKITSRICCAALALVMGLSSIPVYAFAEDDLNDPFIVVSLGDSYSSGEGIPEFYGPVQSSGESDEDFWNRRLASNDFLAHRSRASWPGQLKFQEIPNNRTIDFYKVPDGETSDADIQWYFVAASGAVSKDFYEQEQDRDYTRTVGSWGNKKTLSGTKYLPKQLDVFSRIDGASVDYVTFTIGGNDLGFSKIVEKAATKSTYLGNTELSQMLQKRWDNINTYINQLETTYKKVAEKAPNAEIIVAGYPRLFENSGKGWLISQEEAVSINTKVTQFNGKIKELIDKLDETYNLHFVSVEGTFAGHEAYSSNAWINKIYISAKDDDLKEDKPSSYSIHPTATGAEKYAECVNREITKIELSKRIGTLAGNICKASDRTTPVTNAQIQAYSPLRTENATPDSNGNYSMELPANRYYVTVNADGYIPFKAYAVVKENQTEYMQTFLMVEGEETDIGSAQGMITNALNGAGLGGVTLDVRKGWNNEDDGEILTTVTTDDYGAYLVTLPIGNYTLCASKEGFAPTMVNIIVQKTNSGNQNGTMTPVLSVDDYRIVLTWGENPRDLDSHVVGTLTSGSSFHVYYNHKSQYDGGTEICNLDVDDTTSYGPETITLHATTSKPYYYYIYRYAGSGTVASSGAQINVYQGERLVTTFNVPTNLGSGDYWNVFAIVDGQLVVRNTMTSSAETSYANTNVALFSLRPANQDEHPEYDDRYPAKEDTDSEATDSTNDNPVESEADIPVDGEDEVALQSETKTIYLSLGEIDRNYTWYVETSERVYPVKEETDEIYSVELPADTDSIFLYGDDDADFTISSGEISLDDTEDENCIMALTGENEDTFEVMWGYYDLETQKVTIKAVDELTIGEDSSEETVSNEETDASQETTATEGTETEEGNYDEVDIRENTGEES